MSDRDPVVDVVHFVLDMWWKMIILNARFNIQFLIMWFRYLNAASWPIAIFWILNILPLHFVNSKYCIHQSFSHFILLFIHPIEHQLHLFAIVFLSLLFYYNIIIVKIGLIFLKLLVKFILYLNLRLNYQLFIILFLILLWLRRFGSSIY